MELLEREGPLTALGDAREQAAQGRGSVVLVTGEPGIGKTALLARFARGPGPGRVLWGNCDDLATPRPLGPFRDLGAELLHVDDSPHLFHSTLLEELAARPHPAVLVLEDVHWADQATIDAVAVVGRRIATLPALVILTYRSGELGPGHPLPRALETIRSNVSLYLQLAPLSRSAVADLAGEDADLVYEVTGGNPFYVTELLAARPDQLPPSVANTVLGRASRLDEDSRRLLQLVSMVPSRVPTRLLDLVMPSWPQAAEEPERRQLLTVDSHHVRFRHELARTAIWSSVATAQRRLLHAEILDALLDLEADPAEIVHHAEAAGNTEVVARYALVAARRAAAVASNREAFAQFKRAMPYLGRMSPAEAGEVLEEYAWTAYLVGDLDVAFDAIQGAVDTFGEDGDPHALGRRTRILSRLHWYAGNGEDAWREGRRAAEILEPLGESVELARAYSGLAQLAMLSGNKEETLKWGRLALNLAESLGAEDVRAHALINLGSIHAMADFTDRGLLARGVEVATVAGEHHEVVRGLIGLGFIATAMAQPKEAAGFVERGRDYADEHQVDTLLAYLNVMKARLLIRSGHWDEADSLIRAELDKGLSVSQLLARTAQVELAVRRGDPEAKELLATLAKDVDRTGELQRIGPVFEVQVEAALLGGEQVPDSRMEEVSRLIGDQPLGADGSRLAAWMNVAGFPWRFGGVSPKPYAAMLAGDWRAAAEAFGEVGWDYDRALMLSLCDEEPELAEALAISRRLGADPLERRVSRRMIELGMSPPARPRASTLTNPAGLTERQLEVASLLAEGMTNQDIADHLFISIRTVEHHVEAILTKLGVQGRKAVAERMAELGDHRPTGVGPANV